MQSIMLRERRLHCITCTARRDLDVKCMLLQVQVSTCASRGFQDSICVYRCTPRIIHRDLKPENLLLSREGHVKLTDLGVAKVVESKTYTMVGTISYRAPEVIAAAGHGHPWDWWALGILLHELMSGHVCGNHA